MMDSFWAVFTWIVTVTVTVKKDGRNITQVESKQVSVEITVC